MSTSTYPLGYLFKKQKQKQNIPTISKAPFVPLCQSLPHRKVTTLLPANTSGEF